MVNNTAPDSSTDTGGHFSFMPRLLGIFLAAVVGVSAGAFIVYGVFIPRMGLGVSGGRADRILKMYEAIPSTGYTKPTAVCLGNSVTIEGVDAGLISEAATGWDAYNYALDGCSLDEMRIITPKLLSAKPRVLIISLRGMDMGAVPDISPDVAGAYALSGFVSAWDKAPILDDFVGQSPESVNRLNDSGMLSWLLFRTAIIDFTNAQVRAALRKAILPRKINNFIQPYRIKGSVSGKVLERHLSQTIDANADCLADNNRQGTEMVRRLTALAGSQGAKLFLVAAPQHPRIREALTDSTRELHELLDSLAVKEDVYFINTTDLLEETQFADALHPNAEGRAVFSRFLGEQLLSLEAHAPVPEYRESDR